MKYKIMFWAMCAVIYVCLFWLLPLTHNDSFSYLAVVLQVHVVVTLIVGIAWAFGYLAHKAYDL
jgi:hypothetical protein